MTTPAPISQRAFAKIIEVSPPAVKKAVDKGRLKDCLVWVDGVAKIADVELARKEWSRNTDYSKAPTTVKEQAAARAAAEIPAPAAPRPAPRPPASGDQPPGDGAAPRAPIDLDLNRENAREKHWKANKAEVEYLEKVGRLVDAEEMLGQVTDAFTRVRSRLGGLPTRIRQQIPHLTTDEVGVIESFIREALEELALRLEDEEEDEDDAAGASPQP